MGNNKIQGSRDRLHPMLNWMEDHSFLDIWRIRNPNTRKYTWVSNTTPPIYSRLDFFIIPDKLAQHVTECDIISGYASDHWCISLNIETQTNKRGRGLWTFNKQLLSEDGFIDQLND